jgi:hypothetical protein
MIKKNVLHQTIVSVPKKKMIQRYVKNDMQNIVVILVPTSNKKLL